LEVAVQIVLKVEKQSIRATEVVKAYASFVEDSGFAGQQITAGVIGDGQWITVLANCSLSSITEHSFQGITPSQKGEKVYGTICYRCLRSLKRLTPFPLPNLGTARVR
jgi:hypothetical protein